MTRGTGTKGARRMRAGGVAAPDAAIPEAATVGTADAGGLGMSTARADGVTHSTRTSARSAATNHGHCKERFAM